LFTDGFDPVKGLLIAALHSGSGKTIVTLGLLRALKDQGVRVASAKAGPDYIDPAYHSAATARDCVNLDPWAMRPEQLRALALEASGDLELLVVEGMMGLYDGAADSRGSSADLAALLGLPVVLVVDCAKQSHSVAALVHGFATFRSDIRVAGVILNRVASPRQERMIRAALAPQDMPILGVLPQLPELQLPSRHLGLVQAHEHDDLELFLVAAGRCVSQYCDLAALLHLGDASLKSGENQSLAIISPPAQTISVARDAACAFSYPHILTGWKKAGAELSFFSPLEDEAPSASCGMVFLPGGYPELYAVRLSSSSSFRAGIDAAHKRGAVIYGECGGYMLLGDGLISADGASHRMLGLLPLETSFAERGRKLGYRRLRGVQGSPFPHNYAAHEFHYSSVSRRGEADPLFHASDAVGEDLGPSGMRRGNVSGSYMHLIDLAGAP
jgi:cobyrinic acid a,c-diamide synthase